MGVGDGDEVTWVSVSVFEEKARALVGLAKGIEVYVEGRLTLSTWTGRDGAERAGFLEYDAGLPRPEAELEAARITARPLPALGATCGPPYARP